MQNNSKKPNRPWPVSIIAGLLVLSGILSVFGVLPLFLIMGTKTLTIIILLISLMIGALTIGLGWGLWKMKKWATVVLTVVVGIEVISLAYSYLSGTSLAIINQKIGGVEGAIYLIISILILIYLWNIWERFS